MLKIIGERFGKLTVLAFAGPPGKERQLWLVRCDCGVEKVVTRSNAKGAVSCGCTRRSTATHGLRSTGAYTSWQSMMQRCYNPKSIAYHKYGGRGIKVCPEWHDVTRFVADMGPRPDGHSIERADVNGDYRPDNCEWLPNADQAKNRRSTKLCDASVLLMRYMHRRGSRKADIAHAFGISKTHAGHIVDGRHWKFQ